MVVLTPNINVSDYFVKLNQPNTFKKNHLRVFYSMETIKYINFAQKLHLKIGPNYNVTKTNILRIFIPFIYNY